LVKIIEGVPGKEGNVIHHEFVKKSKKEIAAQKAEHAVKEKLRKQRREEQESNVRRKLEAKNTGVGGNPEDESEGGEDVPEDDEEAYDADGGWDEDEDISGEEESEADVTDEEVGSEDEKPSRRPTKKVKRHV